MSISNWLYLGVGIAIGASFGWLFKRSAKTTSSTSSEVPETATKKLQQMQLAYQMAREMSQFKAGFLARTTHEVRSPINGIIGLHQLILSDLCENPEEEREFIAQAHERTLKLLKLIDEILKVARTEHGTNKLDIQVRSLNMILQEVYDLTYMLAANRNYPFNFLMPASEIYVLVDILWLRQILVNLVDSTIAKLEEGSIYLSSSVNYPENKVYIWLDVPNHGVISSEPIDLINSEIVPLETIKITPGMRLLLNQTLLEVMGGKLEIVAYPEENSQLTRLQITVPLATAGNRE
ncbi:MAG TPA: HAMP domain-containing sensor histidine kinase [Nostocaceae cyanobacterium]|nr:HAMP domain-containing sensor histidine kinase [Nostocaceae cyanobacterium]